MNNKFILIGICFVSVQMELTSAMEKDVLYSAVSASITPLMEAASEGDIKKLKALLQQADDEGASIVNQQDAHGRTALFWAAENNRPEIIQELLKDEDLSVDIADKDSLTPLMIASELGNTEAARALLSLCKNKDEDRCPNIDLQDTRLNYSPLMRAARAGHSDIIKLLIEVGANPGIKEYKSGQEYDAIGLAEMQGHKDLAQYLAEAKKRFEDKKPAEASIDDKFNVSLLLKKCLEDLRSQITRELKDVESELVRLAPQARILKPKKGVQSRVRKLASRYTQLSLKLAQLATAD